MRDTTSVSTFRVYDGATLQGTTSVTSYTTGGLLPCRLHRAKVEALCGESVLMSAKTVTAHTGDVMTAQQRTVYSTKEKAVFDLPS